MNASPRMDFKAQSAATISTIILVNIIWWMLMIAAIGVGAANMGHCPVQPFIPIFLIVLGGASILSLSMTYTNSICERGAVCILISACMTLLHLFSFCWFIAGSIWVYSVYPPDYSTTDPKRYCQRTTFQFAFVVITIVWVSLALSFLCGSCFICVACCKYISASRRLSPNRSSYEAIGEAHGGAAGGDV